MKPQMKVIVTQEDIDNNNLGGIVRVGDEIIVYPTDPNAPLTFGQKAVGLMFNPSGDDAVANAKQNIADAIDQMDVFRLNPETNQGAKRHASVAITMLEDAQMRMVKALTWKD